MFGRNASSSFQKLKSLSVGSALVVLAAPREQRLDLRVQRAARR